MQGKNAHPGLRRRARSRRRARTHTPFRQFQLATDLALPTPHPFPFLPFILRQVLDTLPFHPMELFFNISLLFTSLRLLPRMSILLETLGMKWLCILTANRLIFFLELCINCISVILHLGLIILGC